MVPKLLEALESERPASICQLYSLGCVTLDKSLPLSEFQLPPLYIGTPDTITTPDSLSNPFAFPDAAKHMCSAWHVVHVVGAHGKCLPSSFPLGSSPQHFSQCST